MTQIDPEVRYLRRVQKIELAAVQAGMKTHPQALAVLHMVIDFMRKLSAKALAKFLRAGTVSF